MGGSLQVDASDGAVQGVARVAEPACRICGSSASTIVGRYRRCQGCAHETLIDGGEASGIVVNDDLDPVRLRKADALVRAQCRVVDRGARGRDLLLDIGCGSGRFLHHCRSLFQRRLGIELSEPSAAFGRREFGLDIVAELPADLPAPSVVTFWHSLEHIPWAGIGRILEQLARVCTPDSRVLICVPNGASFQSRWFGEAYTYYDVPHHLHQFSPRSLDALLRRHGFAPCGDAFIANYIAFGYTQSLLNTIVPAHNYLYQKLKRGVPVLEPGLRRVIAEIVSWTMLPIAVGAAAVLTVLDYLVPARRGVMARWYRKQHLNS